MNEEMNTQSAGSMDDQWGAAFAEEKQAQATQEQEKPAQPQAQPQPKRDVVVRPASFGNVKNENNGQIANMDMILDIPLTISVEIGRTKMVVKDLLQLSQGAVVELEKLAGEPMEILINGRLIARGEAVVVNEKFGVKLTDIVSPAERISRLK
ncbi:MAG: flagellar motor switch protein FliN [Deltaproteobacteria bacterium]|nr:flagellar motor switch protein FliN [Deltaproteobacteria bacterium]